jgi:Polyketide cyclase / dehydrase and lipid transport
MKKILLIFAIALVAFIGFGLFQASKLKNLQIIKSVTVKGSPKEVFDMVRYLGNFPKWSPFLAEDPSQKYEVKGTDGEVGASYHWVGNGGEDVGHQTIMQIDTLSFVGMKCDIQKPFAAQPTFEYSFKQTPSGIEVTQDFKLQSGLVDAFFLWAFGAVKEMENTNQKGLDLLKKAIEK